MRPLTGKQFKRMVSDAGLYMITVYKKADVPASTASLWVNSKHDINPAAYNDLLDAFLELAGIEYPAITTYEELVKKYGGDDDM